MQGSEQPLLPSGSAASQSRSYQRHLKLAFQLSWAVNWLLLVLKVKGKASLPACCRMHSTRV